MASWLSAVLPRDDVPAETHLAGPTPVGEDIHNHEG
jgi:hypothetical protein